MINIVILLDFVLYGQLQKGDKRNGEYVSNVNGNFRLPGINLPLPLSVVINNRKSLRIPFSVVCSELQLGQLVLSVILESDTSNEVSSLLSRSSVGLLSIII